MEHATATELYARAYQQWREVVELGLHDSEDLVYGIMPLLVEALNLDPDHPPSLDLMSDMLMEVGAYEEAVELVEKMLSLTPDEADYRKKLTVLMSPPEQQRRVARAYLHQKRQRLIHGAAPRPPTTLS
jgi:tetratricopeptide (TPR) repeat protein